MVGKISDEIINNNLIKISTNQLKFSTTRIGNCSSYMLYIKHTYNKNVLVVLLHYKYFFSTPVNINIMIKYRFNTEPPFKIKMK